jgi:hypothetical protein
MTAAPVCGRSTASATWAPAAVCVQNPLLPHSSCAGKGSDVLDCGPAGYRNRHAAEAAANHVGCRLSQCAETYSLGCPQCDGHVPDPPW